MKIKKTFRHISQLLMQKLFFLMCTAVYNLEKEYTFLLTEPQSYSATQIHSYQIEIKQKDTINFFVLH